MKVFCVVLDGLCADVGVGIAILLEVKSDRSPGRWGGKIDGVGIEAESGGEKEENGE